MNIPEFQFTDDDEIVDEGVVEETELPTNEETSEENEDVAEASEDEGSTEEPNDELVRLYNLYKENGWVKHEGEFKGTAEEFNDILETQRQTDLEVLTEGILNSVPSNYRNLITILINEGEAVTPEQLQGYLAMSANELTADDFSSQEVAEAYMRSHLESLGETTEVIEDEIANLVDRGILSNRAKALFLRDSSENEKVLKAKAEQSVENKKQKELDSKQFVSDFNSSLQAKKWRPDFQKTVGEQLKSGNINAKLKTIFESPNALVELAAYLSFFDEKTKTFDMTMFGKKATSIANSSTKEKIEKALIGSRPASGFNISGKGKKEQEYEFA